MSERALDEVVSLIQTMIVMPPSIIHSNIPIRFIEEARFNVLNEVVIDRGPSPYLANLEFDGCRGC
jgi:NAD kinase